MNKKALISLPVAVVLAGCWTFNSTPFPETAIAAADKKSDARSVAVIGFESSLVERVAVSGYQTYYVPPVCTGYGRHIATYRPGYYEVVPTTAFVDQRASTDLFVNRAKETLENAGYCISAKVPTWTVEVQFEGPTRTTDEASKEALWVIGTIFFCDYASVDWSAKLKIRDNRTGELVFRHDYVQHYETNVFGLIPIFGIAACEETTPNSMQVWCLTALTDRALADATAFLSAQAK